MYRIKKTITIMPEINAMLKECASKMGLYENGVIELAICKYIYDIEQQHKVDINYCSVYAEN